MKDELVLTDFVGDPDSDHRLGYPSSLLSCLGDVTPDSEPSHTSSPWPFPTPSAFTLGRSVLRKPSKKFFLTLGGLEGTSSLSADPCFLSGMWEGTLGTPACMAGGRGGGGGGGGLELWGDVTVEELGLLLGIPLLKKFFISLSNTIRRGHLDISSIYFTIFIPGETFL